MLDQQTLEDMVGSTRNEAIYFGDLCLESADPFLAEIRLVNTHRLGGQDNTVLVQSTGGTGMPPSDAMVGILCEVKQQLGE